MLWNKRELVSAKLQCIVVVIDVNESVVNYLLTITFKTQKCSKHHFLWIMFSCSLFRISNLLLKLASLASFQDLSSINKSISNYSFIIVHQFSISVVNVIFWRKYLNAPFEQCIHFHLKIHTTKSIIPLSRLYIKRALSSQLHYQASRVSWEQQGTCIR